MRSGLTAIIWGLFGTLLFTLVYASAKLTGGEISAFQILFVRFVSGFFTVVIIILANRFNTNDASFRQYASQRPRYHFLRSLCGSMGGVCIIHAGVLSPIADVTALGLTDGLITMLLSILILGETVRKIQWIGAFCCGIGAGIVVYGSTAGVLFEALSIGLWLALLGAFLLSVESILIKVFTYSEKPLTILLYVNFFSLFLMAVPAFYNWHSPSAAEMIFMILLGPIAILAQYCWVVAYKLADVALVTPINYSWIIFAALLGYFLFEEELGMHVIVGSACIALGGIILSRLPESKKRYPGRYTV